QGDPGGPTGWLGGPLIHGDRRRGTVRPARPAGRRIRRPPPMRGAAGAEGLYGPLPGVGRRAPRAVPGAGPGRAREGDLSGPGRGGAGSDHEPAPVAGGRLPDRPRDRPWGHGGGLRGRAGLARPPGGPEGAAVATGPRPHVAGTVPSGGPRLGP